MFATICGKLFRDNVTIFPPLAGGTAVPTLCPMVFESLVVRHTVEQFMEVATASFRKFVAESSVKSFSDVTEAGTIIIAVFVFE
jgi:hypothetical protein